MKPALPIAALLIMGLLLLPHHSNAQDTTHISLTQFIELGIERSNQLSASESKWNQAQARARQVSDQRYLPKFEITTNHGLVPGVFSPAGLPKDEWHLAPNLKNDWEDWRIFTTVELQALQPLYTWGALTSAVKAAQKGAEAAEYQFMREKDKLTYNLFRIYHSGLLARDLRVLVDEAQKTFDKAEKQIDKMDEEGELSTKDLFQFKIYREKFLIKVEEVRQNIRFIERSWQLALSEDTTQVFLPEKDDLPFLTDSTSRNAMDYEQLALNQRPELNAISAAVSAAEEGVWAEKAQMYPMIYFGFGGEYVHTPRPTQNQPLIGDRFDYINLVYSFGLRQNLNFWVSDDKVQRRKFQLAEAESSEKAIGQGIALEVNDAYKEYIVAQTKVKRLEDALQSAKEWLRTEQIDYDLGLGEVKDLVDAMKAKMELEAEYKQAVFDNNIKFAKLLHTSGILNSYVSQQ